MKRLKRIVIGSIVKMASLISKRDKKIWVFGEWFGERCGDNCTYLANYIVKRHPHIQVCWIANRETNLEILDTNIQVFERDSNAARCILKKAGVAFVGQDYRDYSTSGYNYVAGATSVLLWHGIPWKKIGHDGIKNKNMALKLYERVLDWVFGQSMYLATSERYAEILKSAYNAKEKQILKSGYPRNSEFYDENYVRKKRTQIIAKINNDSDIKINNNVRIITYMPTFRKEDTKKFSIKEFIKKHTEILDLLEKENLIIVEKSHYVEQERKMQIENEIDLKYYVIQDINAQDLLCATDILITDYSGCFFDFLLLNRPIIHYLYDYDYYKNEDRGLYYEANDVVAGSVARTEEELVSAIRENLEEPNLFFERRKKIQSEFLEYESENTCEMIYQQIIKKLE